METGYINDFHTIGYLDVSGNIRGESVSYIKTNRIQNYSYINPGRISSAYYNVYECSGTGTGISVWLYDSNVCLNSQTCSFAAAAGSRSGWNSTTTVSSAGNYSLNMTTLVKSWLKGALAESDGKSQDYGFTLTAVYAGSKYKQFYSPQKSGNGAYISINYTEDTSIANGTYYLRNVHGGRYLDVVRSATMGKNDDNVVQYHFYAPVSQKWLITYLGDGFYRLSPQFNTSKCLNVHNSTIPNTDDHANVNIWDYVAALSQKWRILQNSDGTYRLASQSGNKFLEVDNWSTSDIGNVTQRYWANGNNQKWVIETVNHGQFRATYTNDEDGANRKWYVDKSMNTIVCIRYSQFSYGSATNAINALSDLQASSFYTIHTHGTKTSVKYTNSSGSVTDMTTTDLNNLPDYALKNERIVIYGTCSAGEGGVTADNIVNATYNKGAKTVIGFQVETGINQTNQWLYEFLLASGERSKTVSEAMSDADYWVGIYYFGAHYGTKNRLVRGSTDQRLVD